MFSRSEKIMLSILAFVQFSHIIDFIIIMPLGPKMMKIFQIDPHQFGLLVSIYTLCAGISGLLATTFTDKYDRKHLLQLFFFGFSIGTVACAFAPGYSFLLIARAVTGFFGGVLNSVILAIVSDKIDYARRGTAMGILSTSFSVASIMGLPFGLYLADHFSWHTPFMFLGVLCVIASGLIYFFAPSVRDHLDQPKSAEYNKTVWQNLVHFFKTPNQRNAILFIFFVLFGHFAIIPFLSPSLVINAGFQETQLPLVYFFGGIASVLTAPNIGRMSDKMGKHDVFAMALLGSLLPIFLITHLADGLPIWTILIVTSAFFVMAGGRMIPAQAMVSQAAPTEVRGTFMSIVSCIQQFAMAFGSYMAGLIVVQKDGHLMNYSIVGYLAIASSLIALGISRKLKT